MQRTNYSRLITGLMIAVLAAGLATAGGCRKSRQAKIGTGGTSGVYYPVGGKIAEILNDRKDQTGISFTAEVTKGSVFNINAVFIGDNEFGIAQSDKQYQAVNGLAEWKDRGPQENLRSVCSLYIEAVTLVAAADKNVSTVQDLKGLTVNIGNPGSGQRGNALDILAAAGIDVENDIQAEGVKPSEAAALLQDGRIDAFFYTVGHPNAAIKEATAGKRRKVRFVPIRLTDEMREKTPYYVETTIPIAMYPSAVNDQDVPTIGMKTTIVTAASVPEDMVYALTKAVFENVDYLRQQHQALANLRKEDMLDGLSAELHPGAKRYLKEAGLLKE